MRSKVETDSEEAEKRVRDIRRATRRQYSAEEKIRIVIAGLRGEDSIAELCRKEGINQNLYYRWSKDFLEAGKKRLAGDTARESDQRRGQGDPGAGASAQGAGGRADDREPPA
jgi:transposase